MPLRVLVTVVFSGAFFWPGMSGGSVLSVLFVSLCFKHVLLVMVAGANTRNAFNSGRLGVFGGQTVLAQLSKPPFGKSCLFSQQ